MRQATHRRHQLLQQTRHRQLDLFDSSYTDVLHLENDGTQSKIEHKPEESLQSGLYFEHASIADDGTFAFTLNTTYAIAVIINNRNPDDYAIVGLAGTIAPVDLAIGANVSTGAANPDIDGDVNIWPSADGEVSIKNRLGSTRVFHVLSFSTD